VSTSDPHDLADYKGRPPHANQPSQARIAQQFASTLRKAPRIMCCTGDVARINELCNPIGGLSGTSDKDNVWFALEDTTLEIFKDDSYRDAILPIAEFLNAQVEAGIAEIEGALMPETPKKKNGIGGFLFGR
jgi:hypothetical protein